MFFNFVEVALENSSNHSHIFSELEHDEVELNEDTLRTDRSKSIYQNATDDPRNYITNRPEPPVPFSPNMSTDFASFGQNNLNSQAEKNKSIETMPIGSKMLFKFDDFTTYNGRYRYVGECVWVKKEEESKKVLFQKIKKIVL